MLELEEKDRIYWDEMYSHSLFKMDSEELLSRKFMSALFHLRNRFKKFHLLFVTFLIVFLQ